MNTSGTGHNARTASGFHADPESAVAAHRLRLAGLAERNREALRQSERARFWYAVKLALVCVLGCVIGAIPMAWAIHTTDLEAGRVAWAAGPVIGQTIVVAALLVGWIRWQRDDW